MACCFRVALSPIGGETSIAKGHDVDLQKVVLTSTVSGAGCHTRIGGGVKI